MMGVGLFFGTVVKVLVGMAVLVRVTLGVGVEVEVELGVEVTVAVLAAMVRTAPFTCPPVTLRLLPEVVPCPESPPLGMFTP